MNVLSMYRNVSLALALLLSCALSLHAEEPAPPAFTVSPVERAIVDLTNLEREKSSLPALKINPQLFEAARKHAANMAAQGKLEHRLDDKGHSERISDTGYKWSSARENIAFNQADAKEVVAAWMKSEGHRENILAKDISEIGVGVVPDAKGELYFCQDFALPQSAAAKFHFSIKNVAGLPVMLNTGTPKPATIAPHETMTYTLTTVDPAPTAKLNAEGTNETTFKIENDASYRVEKSGADLKLLKL